MSLWVRLAVMFCGLLLLVLAPSVWIETSCGKPQNPPLAASTFESALPIEHRRDLVNTYLTYPEWSIVHAYEDFAAVQQQRGESGFEYSSSVSGYWRNFCQLPGVASARAAVSPDVRVMLHIIGVSFSVEMAIEGLYENTIGLLTQVWRGEAPSAEDRFSLKVSQDYAAFLRQTPWYEYPFAETLSRFWRETPFENSQWLRATERRFALTLEWGIKSVYARLLGWAAAAAPAPLKIRSVVNKLDAADLAADARIVLINRATNQAAEIETPRYRVFTEILSTLAQQQRSLIEIAGNREIFVTVLIESSKTEQPLGTQLITRSRLQGRPGWERRGIAVSVPGLLELIRALPGAGMTLEHVYDY